MSDFVVTGIPRSGTSLMSTLLTETGKCFCFNEITYNITKLPEFFTEMRDKIKTNDPIPNKFDTDGRLTTDTMRKGHAVLMVDTCNIANDIILGAKAASPYLLTSQIILNYNYPVFAMIRDPVYTLASWDTEKSKSSQPNVSLEVNKVTVDNFSDRRAWVPFSTTEKLSRQAELWNWLASFLYALRNRITIIKLEDLWINPNATLQPICDILEITNNTEGVLENKNKDERFEEADIGAIRENVKKYCSVRTKFGYK